MVENPHITTHCKIARICGMPNHIHGIIQLLDIGRGELHSPNIIKSDNVSSNIISSDNISPNIITSNNVSDNNKPNDNGNICNGGVCKTPLRSPSQTIGAIVRGYKSSVTKQINITGEYDTLIQLWQRNYYEHIIRNEKSYQRISEYIINNPAKGRDDKFYK